MGLILLIIALLFTSTRETTGLFKVVFCSVGQGDAIFIKTPSGADILVDGGPDERVLSCLSENMPFWDRDLDLVIVSHAQADHIGGLISVLKQYKIGKLIIGPETAETPEYRELAKIVVEKNIAVTNPYSGQEINFNDGLLAKILWPEKNWLSYNLRTKEGKILGISTLEKDTGLFGKEIYYSDDLNKVCTLVLFTYGKFSVLLTGDADESIQPLILQKNNLGKVTVLKVPHHGSKKALLEQFLQAVKPDLAVISVGKNSFGHPAQEIIKRLADLQISLLRTDLDGEIKIVSDGEMWEVK